MSSGLTWYSSRTYLVHNEINISKNNNNFISILIITIYNWLIAYEDYLIRRVRRVFSGYIVYVVPICFTSTRSTPFIICTWFFITLLLWAQVFVFWNKTLSPAKCVYRWGFRVGVYIGILLILKKYGLTCISIIHVLLFAARKRCNVQQ